VSRAEQVLRGFLVPAHAELSGASQWQGALQDTHDALDTAIHGTHRARNASVIATKGMVAARERFLGLYNGVAKPLVRGVLRDLGRANEYRRFFRDLQVNESRRQTAPSGVDEVGMDEVGMDEVGMDEVGGDEVGGDEVGGDEVGGDELDS
jgi:hypothetical protein